MSEGAETLTTPAEVQAVASNSAIDASEVTMEAGPSEGDIEMGTAERRDSDPHVLDAAQSKPELPALLSKQKKSVTQLRLENFISAADSARRIDLEFSDLKALVGETADSKVESKVILHGVKGKIRAGEMVALMGPSGAGKSTLLNTLGGRFEGKVSGRIELNGTKYNKKMKKHLGYVLQHSSLLGKLTVFETLTITAQLRLPENMPVKNKEERVEDIIHIMGLDKCRDTLVEMVSGGEKKRTSIANELLMNPSVIFLDEPTSGLDSTSAYSIVSTLRQLARKGRTIICAIHQPSSQMFSMFDRLILLSAGHIVYDGQARLTTTYLSGIGYSCPQFTNPADFILELCTEAFESETIELKDKAEIKDKLISEWKERGDSVQDEQLRALSATVSNKSDDDRANRSMADLSEEQYTNEIGNEKKYPVSWLTQFTILFKRGFKVRRGNVFEKLRFIEMVGVGLLGGLIFFRIEKTEENQQDWLGAAFFIQIFTAFSAMFRGISYFPAESAVIKRERQSGAYALSSYYMSKITSEFPIDIVLPTLMIGVFYWLVGMGDNFGNFILYLLCSAVGVFTANAFGTCLGCAFRNFNDAMTTLALSGITFMLISGFYVKDRAIPVWIKWVQYISHMRWGFLLTLLVIIDDVSFKCAPDGTSDYENCRNGKWNRIKGREMMEEFGTDIDAWFAFLMLVILSTLWHACAYYFLRQHTQTREMEESSEDISDDGDAAADAAPSKE